MARGFNIEDAETKTLVDYLAQEQTTPLHQLYKSANAFLHDCENPQRLYLAHSLGVASIGQSIGGAYYRLTDSYAHDSGYRTCMVRDLVAVERVPDEAVVDSYGERRADQYVGERLWRLRPARIDYALSDLDDVFPAVIEDLAQTELQSFRHSSGYGRYDRRETVEYYMPTKNFRNELEGEQLEHAQHVVSELLGRLAV